VENVALWFFDGDKLPFSSVQSSVETSTTEITYWQNDVVMMAGLNDDPLAVVTFQLCPDDKALPENSSIKEVSGVMRP
jgi:hypothetical protein